MTSSALINLPTSKSSGNVFMSIAFMFLVKIRTKLSLRRKCIKIRSPSNFGSTDTSPIFLIISVVELRRAASMGTIGTPILGLTA